MPRTDTERSHTVEYPTFLILHHKAPPGEREGWGVPAAAVHVGPYVCQAWLIKYAALSNYVFDSVNEITCFEPWGAKFSSFVSVHNEGKPRLTILLVIQVLWGEAFMCVFC